MINRSKLLSESNCNETLEEGHYKTSRSKYKRDRKLRKYTDMQHLEIIFGTLQLAT